MMPTFHQLMQSMSFEERKVISEQLDLETERAKFRATQEATNSATAAEKTRSKASAYEIGYRAGAASNAQAAAESVVLSSRITDFVLAAVNAERDRWQTALAAPEAEGRTAFVMKMLTKTDFAPEAIVDLAAEVAPIASDHGFAAVMAGFAQGARPEMGDAPAPDADAKEARRAELKAAGKAVGKVNAPI